MASSSSTGLGPNPACAGAVLLRARGLLPGTGVPARELLTDPEPGGGIAILSIRGLEPLFNNRGPGGADIGRVVICRAGIGLPPAWGSTSSRFTGIPKETRCRRRIRERVQLGGCVSGGDVWNNVVCNARLSYRIKLV